MLVLEHEGGWDASWHGELEGDFRVAGGEHSIWDLEDLFLELEELLLALHFFVLVHGFAVMILGPEAVERRLFLALDFELDVRSFDWSG